MRSLLVFWMIALLVTWGTGMLVAVSDQGALVNGVHVSNGALPLPMWLAILLLLVSGSGPAIAAMIVSAGEARGRRVAALLGQVTRWRSWWGWFAVALLLPTVLTLLAVGLWAGATGSRPQRWLALPRAFQLFGLPIFPWGEEIGWRGFAQPRLQAVLGWVPASVGVGVMWGLWHQWPLLTSAANGLDLVGVGIFVVYIVSAAVLIGWLYNRAGGKLPLGWAGHAGLNLVGASTAPFGLVAALFGGAALGVALVDGRRLDGQLRSATLP